MYSAQLHRCLDSFILPFIFTWMALCPATGVVAQAPVNGLQAYWPLDGNYADAGPLGINGTNSGSIPAADNRGLNGKAMAFSNPNPDIRVVAQYASHPSSSNLNFTLSADFTYDMMVFISSPYIHGGGLYDNGINTNAASLWFWNDRGFLQINFNFGNGSVGSLNGAVLYDTWHHVTAIKMGTTLYLYIDGVLNSSGPAGMSTPVYSGKPGIFGALYFSPWSPPYYNGHNGKLDEMRIYNRALTGAEISQLQCLLSPAGAPVISPVADTVICQGQSILFTSSAAAGNQWYKDGVPLLGATGQTYSAALPGTYYVINTQSGCAGASSDSVQVSQLPGPYPAADTTVYLNCTDQRINLNQLYVNPGLPVFEWNAPDPGNAPAGSYQLIASNVSGCADTVQVVIKTDIAEWTGAVSSDWHTAGNWSVNRVPGDKTHVIIAGTPVNSCSISNANGSAASVQLRNNNSIQISNGRLLFLAGICSSLPQ
jgi:hypothetical protein